MFSPLTPKEETDFGKHFLPRPSVLASRQDSMAQRRADKTLEMITSEASSALSSCGLLKRMSVLETVQAHPTSLETHVCTSESKLSRGKRVPASSCASAEHGLAVPDQAPPQACLEMNFIPSWSSLKAGTDLLPLLLWNLSCFRDLL